jgi:hypothetical protein
LGDQIECRQRAEEVITGQGGELFEEGRPLLALVELDLPVVLELVLDLGWQVPERDAARRTEDFMAAAAGYREDDRRLREVVSGREAALEHDGATTTEHPLRIPPTRGIHLAVASDDEPELEEVIQIEGPTIEGRYAWHRWFRLAWCAHVHGVCNLAAQLIAGVSVFSLKAQGNK